MSVQHGAAVEVAVLGPLVVAVDGAPVAVSRGTPSTVLSMLALERRSVSSAELAEAASEVRGRTTSVASVHTAIWRLRASLHSDAVLVDDAGYRLDRTVCSIDLDRFDDALERAREQADLGLHAEAAATYDEAIGLHRGPAAPHLATLAPAVAHRLRLSELRAVALEEQAAELRLAGRPREAARALEDLLRTEPLREHAWAGLVLAYADADRTDEARIAYDRARLVLAEHGMAPGRELSAAADRLTRGPARVGGLPAPSAGPLNSLVTLARRQQLIGREVEQQALADLVAPALEGRGAVLVTLAGPAGVGKTRLAAEVAATAHAAGADCWFEICESNAIAPLAPMGLWLRRIAQGLSPDQARDLEAGPLRALFRVDVGDAGTDHEQWALFEAMASLVESVVTRPAVLVVDDAHNAPSETFQFMAHLLRSRHAMPLAIVTTVRPDAIRPDAAASVGALQRLPNVAPPLEVAELDVGSTNDLLAALAVDGRPTLDPAAVYEATGGNAALITAVAAAPENLLRGDAPSRVGGLLHATVQTMLDGLDEEARAILDLVAAAAFVRPVVTEAAVLAAAGRLGISPSTVVPAVRTLAARSLLLVDRDLKTMLFRHEMVRDDVYASIPDERRAVVHLALGRALQGAITGHQTDIDQVADHLLRAWPESTADEVAEEVLKASAASLALLDVHRAARLLESALRLYAGTLEGPSRHHAELLRLLAAARVEDGDVHGGVDAYRQAAELAEAGGWQTLAILCRTAALQIRPHRPLDDDADVTALRRLVPGVREIDHMLLAESLIYLVAVDPSGSTRFVDEQLEAAAKAGDLRLQLKIIQELCWSMPLDRRPMYLAEFEQLAEQLGEPGPLARSALHRWMVEIEHGRPGFDRSWEPIGRLVREAGEPLLTWDWRVWRTTVATTLGEWDEAGRLAEAARTTRFAHPGRGPWLQERPAYIVSNHAFQLGGILWNRGELELLFQLGQTVASELLVRCSIDGRSIQARVAAEVDPEVSRSLCDELLDEPYIEGPRTSDWLASMTYLASACGRIGHRRGAEVCRSLLEPYLGRHTLVSWAQYIGSVGHNLAYIYELFEDWDTADEVLTTSIDQYDAMAARPFSVIARHHRVAILRGRGKASDLKEARLLEDQVRADADHLGMTGLVRRIDAARGA